ncbi:2-succinyl-5-enolpyruvyl-6-hydroxy-3-cyclohexene-1-carboxylic-acid synthase [Duncaniella muris]|uniref:2-succinyl-5-enolpyruvyl-6-hydroxy-3- cyclohexene-1-carboxylic-acid synthase n=2 Tax=Duncaniella muris TaxID=2094150 RepID=UPI00259FF963|nr:2-succinyl-5-enolpyruvyl-6-hydroxy-3-cyclohexene-1-carboxylic-acid synthase [Duncaniella muris]
MITTDKLSCNILADLFVAHGIKDVVLSPGSRNSPLIVAIVRRNELRHHVVIDERSAAFIALGMAIESGCPVALVCTSGTALLNYAPAVAEAFYRGVPLIVISADRPEEWIDQDDSQTLWQQNALAPYVKRSCDLGAHLEFENSEWVCNRLINDALIEAVSGRKGPVHINVRLDAPLNRTAEFKAGDSRVIRQLTPPFELATPEARRLGEKLASPKRVLIIIGFHQPDERLNRALMKLSALPNVVVMTESIANLHSPSFISRIDMTLRILSANDWKKLQPDVVITAGGALVSRHVKEWIRSMDKGVEHWHVGLSHVTVDCFKHLSLRIEMEAAVFLRQLASALQIYKTPCDYSSEWHEIYRQATASHNEYVRNAPWCDLSAFSHIVSHIPRHWNLHLSNGTAVRYAQLMDCSRLHRSECNRGVSGIDGCTSTALGASVIYRGVTLLISGDMSFQYDIAALSSFLISPKFKMIVLCNGGGGIFRFISSTSDLPEMEEFLAVGTRLPLKDLAAGYGFAFFDASSSTELEKALAAFVAENRKPALLAVNTPPELSANVLKQYFERP